LKLIPFSITYLGKIFQIYLASIAKILHSSTFTANLSISTYVSQSELYDPLTIFSIKPGWQTAHDSEKAATQNSYGLHVQPAAG